jgi:hypothetical protein
MLDLRTVLLSAVVVALGVPASAEVEAPESVSLLRLVAAPERYQGKLVSVIGFCWLEFEGNALYLAEADLLHRVSKNAVALTFPAALTEQQWRLSGHYVLIEGRYDAKHGGHRGLRSGELTGISRAEIWDRDARSATASMPQVSVAVAPPVFADVCEDAATAVDLQIEGNGKVASAKLRDAAPALEHHAEALLAVAKTWQFRSRDVTGSIPLTIGFAYRIMPHGSPDADVAAVFYQDSVEVRRKPCD